jgi:hypothetical protein
VPACGGADVLGGGVELVGEVQEGVVAVGFELPGEVRAGSGLAGGGRAPVVGVGAGSE